MRLECIRADYAKFYDGNIRCWHARTQCYARDQIDAQDLLHIQETKNNKEESIWLEKPKKLKAGRVGLQDLMKLVNKKAGRNVAHDLTGENPTSVKEWIPQVPAG